jgi:hypothetical protein
MALGQSYEEFVFGGGFDPLPGNVKLYIKELRTGSIIADLSAMLDQASFVLDHREAFAAFLANFGDLVSLFLHGDPRGAENRPTRAQAERVSQIFEPVAKDDGSQLFLTVHGDFVLNQITYNSQQANTVQNRVSKYLGPTLPGVLYFQHEPMTLFQVRDDPRGHVGDRGVIAKFSSRPVRLHFMNEEAKRRVLDQPDNPLRQIFFVDGEVGISGDKPALYKIQYVHDSEESRDD